MGVNVDGTRQLFDAIRLAPGAPRVVYASSIAVFGAPFPDPIGDDFHPTPLTSYGTQKLIGEALLADYSRRRFFDGVGIRLPTVGVRPGPPNAAASSFFSGIIREPLAGLEAKLPVGRDVRHPHASPRAAVGFLVHGAEIDTSLLGSRRNLTMPGVSVTVGEQIEALARVAGPDAVGLITEAPDPAVAAIVAGWPPRFDAARRRRTRILSRRDLRRHHPRLHRGRSARATVTGEGEHAKRTPKGSSGTMQRQRSCSLPTTSCHRVPFISTPCGKTTTGLSPPASEYMSPADVGPWSCGSPPRRDISGENQVNVARADLRSEGLDQRGRIEGLTGIQPVVGSALQARTKSPIIDPDAL